MPTQRRKLVTLPIWTIEAIKARMVSGIENQRFGGAPRSESEALKRLIILGLEHNGQQERAS